MLPDEAIPKGTDPKETDPNIALCYQALDVLERGLSGTAHVGSVVHLMLARDRFEDRYGDTRGLSGKDAKKSYAEHLLLPLKLLLLHVRGSDQFEDATPEAIRRALNQYLELVLLLMPAHDAASDGARKAVSACLSQWRKEREGSREYRVGKQLQVNPRTEEKV